MRQPLQELPADVRGLEGTQPLPREDPPHVRGEPLLLRGRLQHPRRRVLRPRLLPARGPHRDAAGEVTNTMVYQDRSWKLCLYLVQFVDPPILHP